jgi:hypothetical protein
MAGINQGTPEVAVGEPVRLGDNGEYELEHDPVTDRLIVRDTVNNKEAYVRPETNEQIGNQGAFIRSLVNSEPLADDGRTYATIQEAERNANGWVFVPPGTFNESVEVRTEGMNLAGAGYGTSINGGQNSAITVFEDNVTINSVYVTSTSGKGVDYIGARNGLINNVYAESCYGGGIVTEDGSTNCTISNSYSVSSQWGMLGSGTDKTTIINCIAKSTTNRDCLTVSGPNSIIANSIAVDSGRHGIGAFGDNGIIVGNRVINSANSGIVTGGVDHIIANNRISGSSDEDISGGTDSLLDGNLTGASN